MDNLKYYFTVITSGSYEIRQLIMWSNNQVVKSTRHTHNPLLKTTKTH